MICAKVTTGEAELNRELFRIDAGGDRADVAELSAFQGQSDRFNEISRGRAGAQADDHSILDVLQSRFAGPLFWFHIARIQEPGFMHKARDRAFQSLARQGRLKPPWPAGKKLRLKPLVLAMPS